ncbi:hypothetical protein JOD54_005162 [Actinokineospora baliensis]|uniref:hypothetical protein n=1 Tax=Actinokineospora baliensis TaxID=547056 RepID=UPI00195BCDA9|nr:hypothetical protein [Actinokineospora baliensis]MBM7774958.1 hypothetical protein [Actinokineospora baliensis]
MNRLSRALVGAALAATATGIVAPAAAAEDGPMSGEITNTRESCDRSGWVTTHRTSLPEGTGTGCAENTRAKVDDPAFRYTSATGTHRVNAIPDRQCVTTNNGAPATSAVNDTNRIALLYPNSTCQGIAKVVFPRAEHRGAPFLSMLFITIPR